MAAGDIKGPEAIVVELTAGEAVAVGQVVHFETADDLYDPVVDNDVGKFAVAVTAASGSGVKFRAVVWGPVEVTATAAAIGAFECVMAGSTGLVTAEDWLVDVGITTVGTAMEAFASGATQTIWVGMV